MVTRLNRRVIVDSRIEEFLFGASRVHLSHVCRPLLELQRSRCFYCNVRIAKEAEVDHFIPWARHPDNGIENLVVADRRGNSDKRDHIASVEHLARWTKERFSPEALLASALEAVATSGGLERDPDRTIAVARSLYLRLPMDAKLWHGRRTFIELDRRAVQSVLAA
jgi:hypothetical protein